MKILKPLALAGALIAGLNLSACTTGFASGATSYASGLTSRVTSYFTTVEEHQPGYPRAIPYFPYSEDDATAARVRNGLVANLGPAAGSLTVQVTKGVVELGGRPGNPDARDLAVRITKRTYGVNGVSDKMAMN